MRYNEALNGTRDKAARPLAWRYTASVVYGNDVC